MSGGSFNYLYQAELTEKRGLITAMRDDLAALGLEDAAARTGKILSWMDQMESVQSELADVWKCVEWLCSGDWGVEEVEKAVIAWREKMAPFRETITITKKPGEGK